MIIQVKAIPNAKKNVIKQDGAVLKIFLNAPAVDGKANKALVELLADHFDVKKNQIAIIKGLKSRHKTINIIGIIHPGI